MDPGPCFVYVPGKIEAIGGRGKGGKQERERKEDGVPRRRQ